jgi:cobalt-zinc-cadmium efflux system protein
MHVHSQAEGPERTRKVLLWSLVATAIYIGVTIVAGIRANSLALLSEAGHNLSDFLALLLSWVAVYIQTRPPTSTKTYGYHRAGVLAAFINALSLVGVSFYLIYEGLERLIQPVAVQPIVMMWVAGAGVVMNASIAFYLRRSSRDVNIRSAFLHEIGDTVSTAAVILGGWAILVTGKAWIDSLLSCAISGLILWSAFGIIRETLNILLEGIPRGLELARIVDEISSVEGVNDVHHLHVWSLGSETHALSCHISIEDIPPSASERILREVNERLRAHFRIEHTTIQFEHVVCDVAHGCVVVPATTPEHPHPHTH